MSVRHANGWACVFDRNHARLRGFFRRRRIRHEDTDDLVQEVYVRLLRSRGDDQDDVANPEAYLFTVAANLMREHAVRRQRNVEDTEDIEVLEDLLTDGCHPEMLLEREQRHRQLDGLLRRLPARTRDVLVLQYRDGLSYRQIGERLGLSVHAVKKHVSRGLEKCRQSAGGTGA